MGMYTHQVIIMPYQGRHIEGLSDMTISPKAAEFGKQTVPSSFSFLMIIKSLAVLLAAAIVAVLVIG
jgi:hypothetical protein